MLRSPSLIANLDRPMTSPSPGSPRWRPAALLMAVLLLVPARPAAAQGGASDQGEADGTPAVRPTFLARLGPAVAGGGVATMIATGGVGLEALVSDHFGLRGDAQLLVALEEGETAFVGAPAAVFHFGEDAPDGVSLRAGPLVWTGLESEFSDAQVVGVVLAPSFPLGTGAARLETSVSLLTAPGLILEIGLGAVPR